MWTRQARTSRLVLFNTSHKHTKITRPPRRVLHVTRAQALSSSLGADASAHLSSGFGSGCCSVLGSCSAGPCFLQGYDSATPHHVLADGSRLPGLYALTALHAGAIPSCCPRPRSHCTMTRPRTQRCGIRQRKTSTDGRLAYPGTNHHHFLSCLSRLVEACARPSLCLS